jgi:hypothetical protein
MEIPKGNQLCARGAGYWRHVANEKKKWRSRRPMKGLDVPEINGYRLYSTSKYFLVKI